MTSSAQDQGSAITAQADHAAWRTGDDAVDALLAEAIALARRVDRRLAGWSEAAAEPASPLSAMRVEN
jgi:hypothetical protein